MQLEHQVRWNWVAWTECSQEAGGRQLLAAFVVALSASFQAVGLRSVGLASWAANHQRQPQSELRQPQSEMRPPMMMVTSKSMPTVVMRRNKMPTT